MHVSRLQRAAVEQLKKDTTCFELRPACRGRPARQLKASAVERIQLQPVGVGNSALRDRLRRPEVSRPFPAGLTNLRGRRSRLLL